MVFELDNNLSKLVVLLTILIFESVEPQLIDLLVLHGDLLKLIMTDLVVLFHFSGSQLHLKSSK